MLFAKVIDIIVWAAFGFRKHPNSRKSTFVSTMGKDEARVRAEMLVEQAARHLKIFSGRAEMLEELAHYVLERRA